MPDNENKILNIISSINSAVDFYGNSYGTGGSLYINNSAAIKISDFIVNLLKKIIGENALISKLSNWISENTYALEYPIKMILLGYVETMMSCSVKPLITEEMILKGVYFDLQEIDLFNILSYEPVINGLNNDDKPGKYLYFGCNESDGIKTIPDLVNCKDFNAFLWYVKNSPGVRCVWKNRNKSVKITELTGHSGYKVIQTKKIAGIEYNVTKRCRKATNNGVVVYYTYDGDKVTENENGYGMVTEVPDYAVQPKDNGIVTLEYNARSTDLSDSEHYPMNVKEPISNCLHVFIGCCTKQSDNMSREEKKYSSLVSCMNDYENMVNDMENICKELDGLLKSYNKTDNNYGLVYNRKKSIKDSIKELKKYNNTVDVFFKQKFKYLYDQANGYVTVPELSVAPINGFHVPQSILNTNYVLLEKDIKQSRKNLSIYHGESVYPSATSNYYYMHPLIEFNKDLIWSMQLFDVKTLTAQLINALTGCFEYSSSIFSSNGLISFNIVRSELENLILKVIDNDNDYEMTDDCFFTFGNDSYNDMVQATEMKRMGLYTVDGVNITETVKPSEVFSKMNSLPENASNAELSSSVNDAIELSINGFLGTDTGDFVNLLVKKLTYVIVSTFLTPKIYMIIMFNIKILEKSDRSFNLSEYLAYCRMMLVDVIKASSNQIFDFLKGLVINEVERLMVKYRPLMIQEQYRYYKDLIESCMECLKNNNNDWLQDDVKYADITGTVVSIENEC